MCTKESLWASSGFLLGLSCDWLSHLILLNDLRSRIARLGFLIGLAARLPVECATVAHSHD
jgi:hypothetical protein